MKQTKPPGCLLTTLIFLEENQREGYVLKKMLLPAAAMLIAMLPMDQAVAEYPEKQIEWIVPFKAGGGNDRWSRILSTAAQDVMGHPIRVQNVPGASATLGWQDLLKRDADGYSVMISSPTSIIGLTTEPDAPFSPEDVKVVCFISAFRGIILSKPDAPWSDWQSFVEYAKQHPGELTLGSTYAEMVGAKLAFDAEGLDIKLLTYDSTSDSVTDLLGGHVDLIGATETTARDLVLDNKGQALINVSTIALPEEMNGQLGNPAHAADLDYPTINYPRWIGVHPDTSDDQVEVLAGKIEEMLAHESVQALLKKLGEEVIYVPTEQAQADFNDMVAGIKKVVPNL